MVLPNGVTQISPELVSGQTCSRNKIVESRLKNIRDYDLEMASTVYYPNQWLFHLPLNPHRPKLVEKWYEGHKLARRFGRDESTTSERTVFLSHSNITATNQGLLLTVPLEGAIAAIDVLGNSRDVRFTVFIGWGRNAFHGPQNHTIGASSERVGNTLGAPDPSRCSHEDGVVTEDLIFFNVEPVQEKVGYGLRPCLQEIAADARDGPNLLLHTYVGVREIDAEGAGRYVEYQRISSQ